MAIHHAVKNGFLILLTAWMLMGMATPASAQPNSPDGIIYRTGVSWTMRLGKDLFGALTTERKNFVNSQPISIEMEMSPQVRMLYYPDEPKPIRGVWISVGFIDLVNRVAHAAAISTRVKKHKDYLDKYILLLAQEDGKNELQPLPNDTDASFWTDDVMNEQQGNFNSIVGILVGLKLAHHYLGHYDKYHDKLDDDKELKNPINSLITPDEWEAAFKLGMRNAYDGGCLMEGANSFFQTIDRMPKRPEWTIYFLPQNVKVGRLIEVMKRSQKEFLNGK